jgi:hypothetical protein
MMPPVVTAARESPETIARRAVARADREAAALAVHHPGQALVIPCPFVLSVANVRVRTKGAAERTE